MIRVSKLTQDKQVAGALAALCLPSGRHSRPFGQPRQTCYIQEIQNVLWNPAVAPCCPGSTCCFSEGWAACFWLENESFSTYQKQRTYSMHCALTSIARA